MGMGFHGGTPDGTLESVTGFDGFGDSGFQHGASTSTSHLSFMGHDVAAFDGATTTSAADAEAAAANAVHEAKIAAETKRIRHATQREEAARSARQRAVENVASLRRRGVELRAAIDAAVRREEYGDAHRCKSALVKLEGDCKSAETVVEEQTLP